MLGHMDESGTGGWAPLAALPDVARDRDATDSTRLTCDGEVFELRSDGSRGTRYTWLTGPNPGYGFTAGPTVDDVEQHLANIRGFLTMIDPETGYIEDD
jgi:hypothetical protein